MKARRPLLLALAGLLASTGCGRSRPIALEPPSLHHLPLTATVSFTTGQLFMAGSGRWVNGPNLTYAWRRCNSAGAECVTIPWHGTNRYRLTRADIGRTIRSAVTATNASGSSTQESGATPVITMSPFVGKAQSSLTLNGTAVRLLGYNIPWVGPSCSGASDAWLQATFPKIVADSRAKLVRAGMYQTSVGGRLSFATFDRYVAWARRYGLRIVPVLTNEWGECENLGAPPKKKHLSWYQSGYTRPESAYQPLSYEAYVERFVRRYANVPTIAWYQLVNEPEAGNPDESCSESAGAAALRKFADAMTASIKRIDSNHLVDLGSVGWCGGQNADFGYVNAGGVDLCDAYHDYTVGTQPMPPWGASHVSQCLAHGKPSFVGEAGICAFVHVEGNCVTPTTATTLAERASDFKTKINAGLQAGVSGYLIWAIAHQCSGKDRGNEYDVGANNGTLALGCPVPEVDPTAAVLAGFARP
jgi:hypothetical protein